MSSQTAGLIDGGISMVGTIGGSAAIRYSQVANSKIAGQILRNGLSLNAESSLNFDIHALSRAGQVSDRNGLTKAGRALQKHSSRPGSAFPKPSSNKAGNMDLEGQFHLDNILTNPQTVTRPNKFGGLNYYTPDGRGICFDGNGSLRGFLES